jgi:Ca2+/Na+ antiporter
MLTVFPRERFFFTILLTGPVIILFIALYRKCFAVNKLSGKSVLSAPYIYFLSLLFIILPQFILNVDWGRWLASVSICLFMGFLFLLWKKDRGAVEACAKLSEWVMNHKWVSLAVIIYIAGLSKLDHYALIKESGNITRWMIINEWFSLSN